VGTNGKSLKFKFMSENTLKILNTILANQNYLKYVKYLTDYPLQGADISPADVFKNNVSLSHFREDIVTETQITVFFCPYITRFKGTTLSDDDFLLVTVIPNEYWTIQNNTRIRAMEMAREVIESIDQQYVAGIGKTEVIYHDTFKVNTKFQASKMVIRVPNAAIIEGC
jgi:hypothetical protein